MSDEEFIKNLTSVTKQLNQTLADNLIIDADVVVPEKIPNKTYKAVTKNLDIEKVKIAFLKDKEIVKEEKYPDEYNKNIINYYYELSDSSSLAVVDKNIFLIQKR